MNQVRYYLEQRLLPEQLFSDNAPLLMMSLMRGKGAFLIDMLNLIGREQGYQCPYGPEDFTLSPQRIEGIAGCPEFGILEIGMPEPEAAPLSRRIFICHDLRMRNIAYYTLEKGHFGRDMLCSRRPGGVHANHGNAPAAEREAFYRVLRLYSDELREHAEEPEA